MLAVIEWYLTSFHAARQVNRHCITLDGEHFESVMQITMNFFFSSSELKAQVNFSDRPLSFCPVRLSVNFYIFDFFSSTTQGQF
jgi:hypothetical protein